MMLMRPSFQLLGRSIAQSFNATRSQPSSIRQFSTQFSSPSPIKNQVINSNFKQSFRKASSWSAPHAAPARDAPTSFSQPGGMQRLLVSVGIVGLSAAGASIFFNRPTRDGPMDEFSSSYLNATFRYLGAGLSLTAAMAVGLHRVGFSQRLMMANPWIVLGGGLVASIGGMIGAQTLEPGSPGKYASWILFNAAQAAVLSPLLFVNPAILARAGLYTAGIMGSLCYVGATAKDGQFLYLGGPLLCGITVVALSSIAPMILPRTAFRALAVTESLSLYGGLAVFSAFILYDTSKILAHAKHVQAGHMRYDPLRESIGLELDFINIFIRLVTILGMRDQKKR